MRRHTSVPAMPGQQARPGGRGREGGRRTCRRPSRPSAASSTAKPSLRQARRAGPRGRTPRPPRRGSGPGPPDSWCSALCHGGPVASTVRGPRPTRCAAVGRVALGHGHEDPGDDDEEQHEHEQQHAAASAADAWADAGLVVVREDAVGQVPDGRMGELAGGRLVGVPGGEQQRCRLPHGDGQPPR